MAEKKEVKKRNVAIEFWRFFTAVAIMVTVFAHYFLRVFESAFV